MRSILNNGEVSKKNDEGTAWAKLWGAVINRCEGFGDLDNQHSTRNIVDDALRGSDSLVCHPFTVLYGHAASRGLDIKKWSKGLDSGYVSVARTFSLD